MSNINPTLVDTYFNNYDDLLDFTRKLILSKVIAEDIMQMAYIRIQNKISNSSASNHNYIKKTIRNLVKDYKKINKKYDYIIDNEKSEFMKNMETSDLNGEETLNQKQHIISVINFLESLPTRQKQIALEMCQGLNIKTVAKNTKFTYWQVKDSWKQISNKLKKELNIKDL